MDDSGAYECQAHTATNRLRSQSARLEVLKPPSDVSMVPVPGSSGKYKSETVISLVNVRLIQIHWSITKYKQYIAL